MSIEAMRQALEALEDPWKSGPDGVANAITALRAAIEQKPVLWYHPLSGRVRFEETPKWIPLYK